MSIRKKIAAYLMAGIVALSTLGSSLMSMPVFADTEGTDNLAGAVGSDEEMGLASGQPMFAIYLADDPDLSDGVR